MLDISKLQQDEEIVEEAEVGALGDEPTPFPDADAQLGMYLALLRLCIERFESRATPLHGRAAGRSVKTARTLATIERDLALLGAEIESRRRLSSSDLPIERLRRCFALSDHAVLLLVAAAAPSIDVTLCRQLAQVTGEGKRPLDLGFLLDLLATEPAQGSAFLSEVRPSAPLVRYRLMRLGTPRGRTSEVPLLHRSALVPERVCSWLRGEYTVIPETFEHVAVLREGAPQDLEGQPDVELHQQIARVLYPDGAPGRQPILLTGPSLAGKSTAVLTVQARHGRPTLEVDLEALALVESASQRELLMELVREACFCEALLLFRHADVLQAKPSGAEGQQAQAGPQGLCRSLLSVIGEATGPIVLTSHDECAELSRRIPGLIRITVDLPGPREQLELWRKSLGGRMSADLNLASLVRRYRLTPGDILAAGQHAAQHARLRDGFGAITAEDVVGAIRQRLRHRLAEVAEVLTTSLTWDDLVLPAETLERIHEVIHTFRYQGTVLRDWDFQRKLSYGRGLGVLFYGTPGTGKTMVATLVAKALGLELFRVDLSRVVSKWVGETEKNLSRVFDEAKNSQAVILFDEADSLFAKRTEVRTSNDRYANLEVNYLLQRLEAFDGVVLLTTNRRNTLDEAFCRRLRFRIEFPEPDVEEREALWRSMFPASVPLSHEVDFHALALRFEMTGAHIKNAAVRAAFWAAATPRQVVTQEILMQVARIEWEEMGRLPAPSRLRASRDDAPDSRDSDS